ncbi:uncharacterized protein LOC123563894 [Mercenaria mercenaria]|uniref:uncharacterized protein LOC123563894 n=1 Tax=Mercenaria mercenaria TaxID=6596 RepID=UPI001E1D7BFE|nr:uncharacterized protein LOC123563894 [Mercenaria mercenaria]
MTDHLCTNILGAVDTLPLFKKAHPGLEKYSQEHLVGLFVKQTYSAHNALSDVKSLQKLCTTVGVSNQQMSEHSCSLNSALDIFRYKKENQQNIATLVELKENKVLSKGLADRIGGSGLCLAHLKLAVQRSKLTGLSNLLCEPFHGKPRVTKNTKIIEKLYNYLKEQ